MIKLFVNSYTILVVTSMFWSGKKKLDFHNLRVLRGILGGVFKNQKLFRIKQYLRNHQTIFYLSILCANITIFLIFANFSIFWRMFNCDFWNANLGYLETFFRGMLESKLAQNNLNFKCYFKFYTTIQWIIEFFTWYRLCSLYCSWSFENSFSFLLRINKFVDVD